MAEEVGASELNRVSNEEFSKKYNGVVYGADDGFSIDRFFGNDPAYDLALDDAETKLGYKMDGDRELMKFYLDRIIEGVAVSFKRKGKEHLISQIRLGFNTKTGCLANAELTDVVLDDKTVFAPCVFINLETLEDMSFFDSDEDYFWYKNEGDEEASLGPAWYAARELGVEEGAHILYMFEHDRLESDNKNASSWEEYHERDIEFDGLNERIIDTEEQLINENLSVQERVSIRKVLTRYKRILQNSHKRRSFRQSDPKLIDLKPFRNRITAA